MATAEPLPGPLSEAPATGIDHVELPVRDYRRSRRFYGHALRPLGFSVLLDWPDRFRLYLGVPPAPSSLWIVQRETEAGSHVSLAAPHRGAVDAFYAAALAAGGSARRPPAPRPEHTASAYGAEVVDPDGNVLEALCRHAA